jgi:hypothetical protein
MLLRLGLLLSSGWLVAWLWGAADAQFSGTVFARNPSALMLAQAYNPPAYTPPAYSPPSPPQPPAATPPPPPVNQPVWETPTYYPSRNYPTTYYR